jgi:hypothetical protein
MVYKIQARLSNGRGRGNGGGDTIAIRLAYADPGQDIRKATVSILCTYTSTKAVYKTTDYPSHSLILLSSPLLPSPLLVFFLPPNSALLLSAALLLDPPAYPLVDGDVVRLSYK